MTRGRNDEVRSQLDALIKDGLDFKDAFKDSRSAIDRLRDEIQYQKFYTISSELVRQIMPSRYQEFCLLYRDEKRKTIDLNTYTIRDYLNGIAIKRLGDPVFDTASVAFTKFMIQVSILSSLKQSLDSVLVDLRTIVSADLYDSEVEACRGLAKAKHLRSAGALAGVILEKHLGSVVLSKSLSTPKRNPTIADLTEVLKANNTIDTVQWRGLQRLADIRNLAVHAKGREPTPEEISELIDGVDKTLKVLI